MKLIKCNIGKNKKLVTIDIKPEEWDELSKDESIKFLPLKSEWEESRFIKDEILHILYKTNRKTKARHDFYNQRLVNILVRDFGEAYKSVFKDVNNERTELDAISKGEVYELKTYVPTQKTIDWYKKKIEKFDIEHIHLVSPKIEKHHLEKLDIPNNITVYRLEIYKEPIFKWFREMNIENKINYHYRHIRVMDSNLRFSFQERLMSPSKKHTIENKVKKQFIKIASNNLIWKAYYSLNQFYDPVYEKTGRGRSKNMFIPAFDIDTDKHYGHHYDGHQYCKECINSAKKKLKSAIKKLDNIEEIYFSGAKGFHIYTGWDEVDEKKMVELNELLAPEADQFTFLREEGVRFDEHRIVKFPHSICGDTLCAVEPYSKTNKIVEVETTDKLVILNG